MVDCRLSALAHWVPAQRTLDFASRQVDLVESVIDGSARLPAQGKTIQSSSDSHPDRSPPRMKAEPPKTTRACDER
jgi:hypothetical protein